MYEIDVKVKGVSPLMQHRFKVPNLKDMVKGGKIQSGAIDYSQEWHQYLYANAEGIFQPAAHFEGAMARAAANYKITGKRGKTYKELFNAAVFVTPEEIPFGIPVPEELDTDGDKPIYLDMRPVMVNRSHVIRIRPTFAPGWELEFTIEVIDDQISPELVQDVLLLAGKTCGVGDFRPKFGRFTVVRFEVHK